MGIQDSGPTDFFARKYFRSSFKAPNIEAFKLINNITILDNRTNLNWTNKLSQGCLSNRQPKKKLKNNIFYIILQHPIRHLRS